MRFSLAICVFFSGVFLSAQSNFTIGARAAALGGASSVFHDVWSAQNNQAGLGFIEKTEMGAYYENRFLLKELGYTAFCAAVPIKKKGGFGITLNSFGYSVYRQSKAGVGYGMKFGPNFSAGIQLDYLYTQISDAAGFYGRKGVFTGELGFQARLTKQVIFAGHIFNPMRVKLSAYNNEIIPATIKAGLQYKVSEKVSLITEAQKSSYQKFQFKGGIEYLPAKDFYLRAGVSTNPVQMSFGAGVNLQGLRIDLSSSWHSVLGFSPQIGMSYQVGYTEPRKNQKEN
jgi:hypothetical protein